MITLEGDHLVFRFPEVHEDAGYSIRFQRTLRIPDDEKEYPLPPGLGEFPLRLAEPWGCSGQQTQKLLNDNLRHLTQSLCPVSNN